MDVGVLAVGFNPHHITSGLVPPKDGLTFVYLPSKNSFSKQLLFFICYFAENNKTF